MTWSAKRAANLIEDLEIFLGDLCTEWGFCNRLTAEELIVAGKPVKAVEVAKAVLLAEGMNPECEVEWERRIRNRFIERYGSAAVTPAAYSNPPD